MEYKGYTAHIEFDAGDNILVGHIDGISDIVGFHAESVAGIEAAFHEAVDDYLAACAHFGEAPQKPSSGKVMLRIAPRVHAAINEAAGRAGKSLNKWAETALAQAAGVAL